MRVRKLLVASACVLGLSVGAHAAQQGMSGMGGMSGVGGKTWEPPKKD